MNYPKMIIFDYGETLLTENEPDFMRANEMLINLATKNKSGATAKDLNDLSYSIWETYGKDVRDMGFEISSNKIEKYVYEYFGIEFDLSAEEVEILYWKAVANGNMMPNTDKMLDYLNSKGVRTAVVSNIGWSGNALTERINRLLPNNKFEFIIASSDYIFRKPSPMIFNLALRKADLNANEVWYCGNDLKADVQGSSSAEIFPVWYDNYKLKKTDLDIDHLYINEWEEMIDILEKIK
ncbi:MAG: HAD family hydrolase [Clostridia bacterium]